MLIDALSASSSTRSIGSRIVSVARCALCVLSQSIRLRNVLGFFLMTNTAGSFRFCSGTFRLSAIPLWKSLCEVVKALGTAAGVVPSYTQHALLGELTPRSRRAAESDEDPRPPVAAFDRAACSVDPR